MLFYDERKCNMKVINMKNTKIIFLCCLSVLLLGCRQPEYKYVDFSGTEGSFVPFRIQESVLMEADGSLNNEIQLPESIYETSFDEQSAGSSNGRRRIASTTLTDMVGSLLGSINSNKVLQIAGTYKGRDLDGSELIQSGKVILPKSGPIKNVILVSHYTICANHETPSETFPLEGIMAGKGYAVVMADYIGYGVTAKRIHPYLHAESTGKSVVDMLEAVIPYLEKINQKPESEEIILFGYSQGGATTLEVMKLLEKDYSKKYKIKQVYAGAGPYDMAATYDLAMEIDYTGIPCAIPMIVQGISEGERLNLDMKDFFQPVLLAHYNEWINSKQYTVREINERINCHSLKEIMTDTGRDKQNKSTAQLYKSLMRNSVLDFRPQAPIFMFHSRQDDTVPFVNSEKAESAFKGCNVRYDFGDYGIHAMGFVRFLSTVQKDLD